MPKTRVLFDLPEPFLRDLVGRLLTAAGADTQVVADVADFPTIEAALIACRPDVVVMSGARDSQVSGWYRAGLLTVDSRVAVLSDDGRDAVIWCSSVERREILDVQAQGLVELLVQ